MKTILNFVLLFTALMSCAFGQADLLEVRMSATKKSYMAHEHVRVYVDIKNNGAADLRLHNQDGVNWLEFVIKRNSTADVQMVKQALFADVLIPSGQQVRREVVLTTMYPLTTPGNYTIRARVNAPNKNIGGKVSDPVFFDIFNGATIFKKQVGVKAAGGRVTEYRILSLNRVEANELYFQSFDVPNNKIISTYTLGRYIGINRPKTIIDESGHLNILYQIDADKFRHICFGPRGNILLQQVHKSTVNGIPTLLNNPNAGNVVVRNSIIFDAEAEAEKKLSVHNISQRPPFAY